MKVIDLIAKDLPDLLSQLDDREVRGKTLKTANATVVDIPMTRQERVLQLLSHPELMMILMLVAIYGIIGELSNPGAILPGVVGAIALILVLYMSTILPVNIAGLALIGLAVVLFIVDIYAPTHGVLTVWRHRRVLPRRADALQSRRPRASGSRCCISFPPRW